MTRTVRPANQRMVDPRRRVDLGLTACRVDRGLSVVKGRSRLAKDLQMRPASRARSAAWVRSATCSFVRMLLRWLRTVFSLIPS